MDVSPEILVLVSAAELAKQTGNSTERKLEIWRTAVKEILDGLETDNNEHQRKLWDYKLHTLLFSSILREFCQQQDGLKVEEEFTYFETVFKILPPCPREVYYDLVKEFHWQRLLLECLHQLICSEDVCLAIMEDMLVYCDTKDNCEILSAITELFLSESSGQTMAQLDALRKCSGPYMSMGSTADPLVRGHDSAEKYQQFFQHLFISVQKTCLSISCLEFLCNSKSEIAQNQYFKLFASVIGLGWVIINSALESGVKDCHQDTFVEGNIQGLKEFAIIAKYKVDDDSAKLDKMVKVCQLVNNLTTNIHSAKCDIVQNCDKILWDLENFEKENKIPSIHAFLPLSHFPANQWLTLLENIFSSQWTMALQTEIESWESSIEPIVSCLTVNIQFCHLLEKLNNLLSSMEKIETLSADSKTNGTVQETDNSFVKEATNGPDKLSTNKEFSSEKSQSMESSNPSKHLLKLLPPLLKASDKVLEKTKEAVFAEALELKSEVSKEEILSLIDDKRPGWEGHLDTILSGGLSGDDSIKSFDLLSLLEQNIEYLATEQRVTLLFDLIQSSSDHLIVREKGWKILLRVFSCLPVMLQDSLISGWYGNGYEMVPESDTSYQQTMTMMFNRLVKAGHSQVLSICGLALQNPEGLFKKAVSVAIKNKQQTKLIVQLLQRLPMLCRTSKSNRNDDSSLLCRTIHHFLGTSTLQSAEEENLVAFVQLCLERFENSSLVKLVFTEEPILDVEELLLMIILPYIHKENMLREYQPITCRLSLKLFNRLAEQEVVVAMQQPLVFLLCLCEMLEECENLWDNVHGKNFFKREIITAIDCLTSIVVSERSTVWFTEQVCQTNLSVLLRVRCFLELDENEDYLKDISRHLWSYDKETGTVPRISEAFLVSSVDNQCLQASLEALLEQDNTCMYPWQQVVFSLTQILPNLLIPEWLNTLKVCQYLINSGKLVVNYPTNYINYLPWIDFTDMQIPLGIVKLLGDCCEVWSQSNSLREDAWSFVVQGLVNSVKEFGLSECKSPIKHSFLLTQIFCQLCQTLSILPPHCGEHICLLMMKILTIYKGVKSKLGTANQNDTTENKGLNTKEAPTNQNAAFGKGVKSNVCITNHNAAFLDVSRNQDVIMADIVDKLPAEFNQEKQSLKLQLQDLSYMYM